jgi:hypothetical protein
VRDDLTFDRAAIFAIALARTRASVPPAGHFRRRFGDELRLAWGSAIALRDAQSAEIWVAALSPTERAARRLELNAELAASAIPSRREEAKRLHAEATALRAMARKDAA